MAAKLLTLTLLSLGVMVSFAFHNTPFNQVSRCPTLPSIEHFNITYLCGKVFYAAYVSGNDTHMSCSIGTVLCNDAGTIVELTKTFFDGIPVNSPSDKSTLSDVAPGVVSRVIATEDGTIEVKDILLAYTSYITEHFKMAYTICSDTSDNQDRIKVVIITSDKEADLTSELQIIKKFYPNTRLYSIPMLCPDINSIQW